MSDCISSQGEYSSHEYKNGECVSCGHVDLEQVRADAKREALEGVRTLIQDLTTNDDDPCQFDHHGGCQAHGYLNLEHGEVCPQEAAKRWLQDQAAL